MWKLCWNQRRLVDSEKLNRISCFILCALIQKQKSWKYGRRTHTRQKLLYSSESLVRTLRNLLFVCFGVKWHMYRYACIHVSTRYEQENTNINGKVWIIITSKIKVSIFHSQPLCALSHWLCHCELSRSNDFVPFYCIFLYRLSLHSFCHMHIRRFTFRIAEDKNARCRSFKILRMTSNQTRFW